MPRLYDRPDFPDFPPIRSTVPLTAADERAVREVTALAGRHDCFNWFKVPGVINKWGQEKRMRAAEVIVSDEPVPDVSPEASLDPVSGRHIALVEEEGGGVYGHAACARSRPATRPLIILTDRHGRGWAYDPRVHEAEPVHLRTAPLVRDFFTDGTSLAETVPFSGDLSCQYGLIEAGTGRPGKPDPAVLTNASAASTTARSTPSGPTGPRRMLSNCQPSCATRFPGKSPWARWAPSTTSARTCSLLPPR